MTTEKDKTADVEKIRTLLGKWEDAIRAKDSHRLTSGFANDVVLFDLVEPLEYDGTAALRERAEEWLASFQGPIDYEIKDLRIMTGEDLAFCHSLNHVKGTSTEGEKIDMWWRATLCFRRAGGNWLVLHEHSSVPFDMETGQAVGVHLPAMASFSERT